MTEPLTITDAVPRILSGELTPSELLEQCLRRIDIYEPAVKAWVYLDRERARRDAARLTDEVKRGQHRGPLHGIPIGVKDIIDVFDMPTGCGSKLWANSYARGDATCVERLRQAGAVILGKTVTTPFAYLDPPVTRNPWNLDRTPGGSSSGSAAAVACGMVLAALGTQTGGSLTRPASYCGVCSLKPTHGWISRDGVLPLAPRLDHVGFLARGVYDLAVLFEATAGRDDREHDCWADPHADAVRNVRQVLEPSRTAVLDFVSVGGIFWDAATPEMRAAVRRAETLLKTDERCDVVVGATPAGFDAIPGHMRAIYASEAAEYHCGRYRRYPDDYPPRITALIEEGLALPAIEYVTAVRFRDDMERTNYNLAVPGPFLTPATLDLPPGLDTTGNPLFNAPWSFLGYPTISLPVGWSDDGLPYAVQLVGGRQREAELFAHAALAERAFGFNHRLPPVPA